MFYLYLIATIPAIGLWWGFAKMQKTYAIVGALFLPILALALLFLNGNRKYVRPEHRNSPGTLAVLIATLMFFLMFLGFVVF